MFVVAMIVLVLSVIAIIRGLTERFKNPINELKGRISYLEKRVNDLENDK